MSRHSHCQTPAAAPNQTDDCGLKTADLNLQTTHNFPYIYIPMAMKQPANERHYRYSDAEYAERFAKGTLRPGLFTHEAHLRLAWIHIRQHGLEQAIENMNAQILAFAIANGARDNFNRTVTTAAVYTMHHFMQRSQSDDFPGLLAEFPRLKTDFKGLLAAHYSSDIFRSKEAKAQFIEPDLAPFV